MASSGTASTVDMAKYQNSVRAGGSVSCSWPAADSPMAEQIPATSATGIPELSVPVSGWMIRMMPTKPMIRLTHRRVSGPGLARPRPPAG